MYPYKVVAKGVVEVTCQLCEQTRTIEVGEAGLQRLEEGNLLIQRALPNVAPELREMLISGTCPECFKRMFAFMDEEDDYEEDYDE